MVATVLVAAVDDGCHFRSGRELATWIGLSITKHDDRRSQWLKWFAARRGFNRTIVALSNNTGRIAWALLTREEDNLAASESQCVASWRRIKDSLMSMSI